MAKKKKCGTIKQRQKKDSFRRLITSQRGFELVCMSTGERIVREDLQR
jgi:hypothetical protein